MPFKIFENPLVIKHLIIFIGIVFYVLYTNSKLIKITATVIDSNFKLNCPLYRKKRNCTYDYNTNIKFNIDDKEITNSLKMLYPVNKDDNINILYDATKDKVYENTYISFIFSILSLQTIIVVLSYFIVYLYENYIKKYNTSQSMNNLINIIKLI